MGKYPEIRYFLLYRHTRYQVAWLAAIVCLLVLACSKESPTESAQPAAYRVVVTPEDCELGEVGGTVSLTAAVLDEAGETLPGAAITWRSSDPDVASVDAAGLVRATGYGSATITATSGQRTGNAGVSVASPIRTALNILFEATGGENWIRNTNWTTGEPLGTWHGVSTAGSTGDGLTARTAAVSRLERLDLSGNSLAGEIPAALGNLVDLRYLDLSENALTGAVPAALGSLTKLEVLKLHGNTGLTGMLPPTFVNLARLDTLSLSGTQLCAPVDPSFQTWLDGVENKSGVVTCEGSPPNADRSALIALYIGTDGANWTRSANWMTDEPLSTWHGVGVNAQGHVDSLNLENNGLSGHLPSALGNLASLRVLDLSDNALSGAVPVALFNLPNLVTLDLTGNQFTQLTEPQAAVVASVSVTPAASFLEEGGTQQFEAMAMTETGATVQDVMFTWTSSDENVATIDHEGLATGVSAGEVVITATSDDISGTASLTVLESITDRIALVALYNATDGPNWVNNENWLSDRPLGAWYGVDTDASGRVVALDLKGNTDNWPDVIPHGLKGPIPPEIGRLDNLRSLNLPYNDLTGPIPAALGNLGNLTWVDLGNNQLTGTIPSELGNLANLTSLYLSNNDLTGPIPPAIGSLGSLAQLDLSFNDLTGPIPVELGNLGSLTWLALGDNHLTGPIPSELSNLANLTSLRLWSNDLTGPIPPAIGSLGRLVHWTSAGTT